MKASSLRKEVENLQVQTGNTSAVADCFAPWYLKHRFHLPDLTAFEQCSDGNYDKGIDGYHLFQRRDGRRLCLCVIQAKYSEDISNIPKGYADFHKSIGILDSLMKNAPWSDPQENKVITGLKKTFAKLSDEDRSNLEMEFILLHLSDEDPDVLETKFGSIRDKLFDAMKDKFETFSIMRVGPSDLGPITTTKVPNSKVRLTVDGVYEAAREANARMVLGVCHLADLVDLYDTRRDELFAKNIRYFLKSEKNTASGPAGEMKKTLIDICVNRKTPPGIFAMYHNGITIVSKSTEVSSDHIITLQDPYILNGCQTVRNAWEFSKSIQWRDKIAQEIWRDVCVPARIVETSSDDLIRSVTVANNRQNEILPSDLRANDPIQVRLQQRFTQKRIPYERQRGYYDTLSSSSEEYENAPPRSFVKMTDLARCIAATSGKIWYAQRPNDLFASDKVYGECFANTKLRSLHVLVFLQNLHDVMSRILKKDLGLAPKNGGPRPSRFVYHAICLVMRYLARDDQIDYVLERGQKLKPLNFRSDVATLLGSYKCGIKVQFNQKFMTLNSSDHRAISAAFEQIEIDLDLPNQIKPFDVLSNGDEMSQS
jgi:hypothetical protein